MDKMKTVVTSRENTGRALRLGLARRGMSDVTARFAGQAGVTQAGRAAGPLWRREAALVMGGGVGTMAGGWPVRGRRVRGVALGS